MRHIRLPIVGVLVLLLAGGGWLWVKEPQPQPIRIGVLHSLTGRMALYERPLVDALRFAVASRAARLKPFFALTKLGALSTFHCGMPSGV